MGAKRTSRLIAVLIAVVMLMTSAIGVFAADSPKKGTTTKATVKSMTQINVNAKASKIKYKLASAKKWKTVKTKNGVANLKGLKKHRFYKIKADGKTFYRMTCKTKIKSAKKKGKTVTVKFASRKCASKYVITAKNTKTGKVVTKTTKKTSKKIKLGKGTWKITVLVKDGKYVGKASKAKKVTIK